MNHSGPSITMQMPGRLGSVFGRLEWSAYLAFQMANQPRIPFLSLEAIKRIQARRVRAMVAHAYRTVPYYRETLDRLGLGIGDFRSAEDLGEAADHRTSPASGGS